MNNVSSCYHEKYEHHWDGDHNAAKANDYKGKEGQGALQVTTFAEGHLQVFIDEKGRNWQHFDGEQDEATNTAYKSAVYKLKIQQSCHVSTELQNVM